LIFIWLGIQAQVSSVRFKLYQYVSLNLLKCLKRQNNGLNLEVNMYNIKNRKGIEAKRSSASKNEAKGSIASKTD